MNSLALTVRDSAVGTVRLFRELLRQEGVYRLLAFLMLIAFLKLIFMQMYYVYPKFGIRELGEVDRLDGLMENRELGLGGLNADLVVSTYVFNIIPYDWEKINYLRNASINLRPLGYLLIEVQCRRESPQCGSGCSVHMKCPSCAKACSLEELDGMVKPFGFVRLCHYYRRHALAVIYQLQNPCIANG